jgi:hypothetical protein
VPRFVHFAIRSLADFLQFLVTFHYYCWGRPLLEPRVKDAGDVSHFARVFLGSKLCTIKRLRACRTRGRFPLKLACRRKLTD